MRVIISGVIILSLAAPLCADVAVYEGDVFPEQAGWIPNAFCDPGRALADAWFIQHVQLCKGFDPPGGQQESFTASMSAFVGEENFFIEWRVETDGHASEIGGVAPSALATSTSGGVAYHFTIARDQARLIRDNFIPELFVEIAPEVAHTHRLELYGDELYVWYIDGDIVDSGVPEGAFPTSDVVLSWRAKSWYLESTTRWDYIRFGTIPVDGSGDYDSDAEVGLDDFYFFHECHSNRRPGINGGPGQDAGPGCRFADFDFDDDVDLRDLAAFQVSFAGGN